MKQSTSAIAWKRAAPVRAYAENLAMVNVVLANMSLKNGAIIECGTLERRHGGRHDRNRRTRPPLLLL
jgi:hypothetical protein